MGEFKVSAGVDEAGRGALAGPVCAAAVVLDPQHPIDGLDDSKKLTAAQREALEVEIKSHALAYAVACVDHETIDDVNILQATYDAMHNAINELALPDGLVLDLLQIDGNRFRPHVIRHECIIGGDGKVASIGAASILAKVHRDRLMSGEMHDKYPGYGFAQHKGYGTAAHRAKIVEVGPCEIHRKTFLTKVTGTIPMFGGDA